MTDLRYGDRVEALPGTTSALWAEGRTGVVVELARPTHLSWDAGSCNLIRWGDETIVMGFRPDEVRKVDVT